ncbi:MAG: DUF456 family protein [Succiniclasticum sp.]|jgi:hypothetical protein|nr:DUF456 family protein [Succiniclasticum sp.]MEE3479021.1 DUF456 family protein [Succiniclasticum sp.]
MEQLMMSTAGLLSDGYMLEALLAAVCIVAGLLLAFFGLGGNTLLVLTGLGFAFFDSGRFFDARLVAAIILVYALGELWEFTVSFFGIKTERVPWWGVFLIGCGTLTGSLLGTMALPVFGSLLGGAAGSFLMAYAYEYHRTRDCKNCGTLAWEAAKMQFMAMLGKWVAAIALAILVAKLIFFYA